MNGGKYKASIQHFEHPSDAYRTFECSDCGGTVRITKTPDFEPEMDWYDVMAKCDSCPTEYLVIGIADDSQMDDARLAAMSFFAGIKDGRKGS
jgi:hypothetical protein